MTSATTALGPAADAAKLTRGGFIGAVAGIAWGLATDRGIEPGYYAQKLYKKDGTATTFATYKPPDGSDGGFYQIINFAKDGSWTATTIFVDSSKPRKQSGKDRIPNVAE